MAEKRTLTTGEIAKHCDVDFRTVIRWIDRGLIKGFRLPGRGDRRVEVPDFLSFLRERRIPVPQEFREDSVRVLIVEDEAPLAQAMAETLEEAGCEVEVAGDGFTAGQLAESFSPAVMTLDLNMPHVDGFQVMQRVRTSGHLAHIKILVVSGLSREHLERAARAGADEVLAKPFKIGDLADKVAALAGVEIDLSASAANESR